MAKQTGKTYHGRNLPAGEWAVRIGFMMHMPADVDGKRMKEQFPSINAAKLRSRELMDSGIQVRTTFL